MKLWLRIARLRSDAPQPRFAFLCFATKVLVGIPTTQIPVLVGAGTSIPTSESVEGSIRIESESNSADTRRVLYAVAGGK
eukprot:682385-Rhodomonas_salina.1